MDTNKIKELIQKVTSDTATKEEKLEVMRELNTLIEAYNKVLKESLGQDS